MLTPKVTEQKRGSAHGGDSERQGRRRPRRQSRRSLAHTSRDGSHRRDGVAQRDAGLRPGTRSGGCDGRRDGRG